jgi:hypothetical protein
VEDLRGMSCQGEIVESPSPVKDRRKDSVDFSPRAAVAKPLSTVAGTMRVE